MQKYLIKRALSKNLTIRKVLSYSLYYLGFGEVGVTTNLKRSHIMLAVEDSVFLELDY
jgi:hypothetical protein